MYKVVVAGDSDITFDLDDKEEIGIEIPEFRYDWRKKDNIEEIPKTEPRKEGLFYKLKIVCKLCLLFLLTASTGLSSRAASSNIQNRKVIESTVDSTKRKPKKTKPTAKPIVIQQNVSQSEIKEERRQVVIQSMKAVKDEEKIAKEKAEAKARAEAEAKARAEAKAKEEAAKRIVDQMANGQGVRYKTRMTNFWPDDGYGTGTKTGSGKTIYNFQVNEHGWYTYQGKLVIGTATPYLLKYGFKLGPGVRMYEYYDELTLTIDGKKYPAIVLDSCGAAMEDGRVDLYIVDEYHKKDTNIIVTENGNIGITASDLKQKVKTK